MNNTQNRRRIAVDGDDTIFHFREPFLEFYNTIRGTSFSFKDLTHYNMEEILGISGEELREEIFSFYRTKQFKQLPPITDARYVLEILSKSKTFGLVTARPDWTSQDTWNSINRHFPRCFVDAHFTREFGGNGSSKKKSHICMEHQYQVIIEDMVHYANQCAEDGISVLLLKKPWNENEPVHESVQRVNDWNEILQILQ